MKKSLSVTLVLVLAGVATADVNLYVDAAPNAYGSPDYAGWQSSTYAAVANGTFVNMSNGVNPANAGTTNFEIQDEIVYSFGDLGKRLTWIYWVPDTTKADIQGSFQVSLTNVWDGVSSDFYQDQYGSTWLTPTTWVDYAGGVMGTAGMAWWGAYNTNTQAELDSDIASWIMADETWTFTTKLNGVETSITSYREAVVPVPAAVLIGLLGLGTAGFKLRKHA